ncbi:hypothetical protein JHK84_029584 [Glycine max]|uniref:Uncharacterized protein n=1 Tax=Glycine soja TaxID=3848 RepID=A0A445ITH4_GLYSO|nr:hypothetical protein JHK85_029991 [Glycine max]KHN06708.1 hypothetical protein glysoja_021254 [Glycine soja]KAG5005318.1 hypothetical protein JHK86_029457 [Glycine max]KAG5153112.1 hypothetical protein JHK84_029584 [Glycine max]KAH1140279.1 hypothetical protein GYH30_029262 [Glycine max]
MGGSVKDNSVSIINCCVVYSFADSTHSYDFLWFLSFHSPLRSPQSVMVMVSTFLLHIIHLL